MKIKETAEKMSYDVVGVNDECDRDFYIDAFTDGAKTMIDKVCEWMKLRLVARIGSEDAHEFLTEFRKAMEE